MGMSDDPTRPVSVAELLARNGTIGAPPPSGHRRRRRTGGVSVAELTGEIPVIRTGEIPVVRTGEVPIVEDAVVPDHVASDPVASDASAAADEVTYMEADVDEVVYEEAVEAEIPAVEYVDVEASDAAATTVVYQDYSEADYPHFEYVESDSESQSTTYSGPVVVYADEAASVEDVELTVRTDSVVEVDSVVESVAEVESVTEVAEVVKRAAPPKSRIPLPRRGRGLERSHDPRPQRRSKAPVRPATESARPSGAEQMNYDPVEEAGSLAELVDQPGVEELRTYLQSSTGTLFSGETVADDLARRGATAVAEPADAGSQPTSAIKKNAPAKKAGPRAPRPKESRLTSLRHAVVAVLQSVLAVAFGGGLFIAFDQLWRWNNIVALVLSVLVILGLVVAVRVVRKTEDILSTLIAVVVGALVTLGPLALLQSI